MRATSMLLSTSVRTRLHSGCCRTQLHSGCRHGWRKGTRRRERRRRPESARARARAAASATERGARKEPTKATQRRFAPSTRRVLYETTSVTEAFCSRSAPIKRASAFCCILPLGVSRVACFRERQPALSSVRLPIGRRPVLRGATPPALSVFELDKHKTPPRLT